MFDNRWDNWSGDFAESFAAEQLDPRVRGYVSEILSYFGQSVRALDPDFPDEVAPGTLAKVLTETMPRLGLPEEARPFVPDVVAQFLDYLQESGRLGDAADWAAQIRRLGGSYRGRLKPDGGVKGVTIRHSPKVTPTGRNDPCPCGSGKKFKKCCMGQGPS